MSIMKDVKKAIKSGVAQEIVVEYADGKTKQYSLDDENKKAVKKLLEGIDWDNVVQVEIGLVDDEEEDYDDDEDYNEDDYEDDDDYDEDDED